MLATTNKNNFEFEDSKLFSGKSRIVYLKDKMEYFIKYNDGKITISSPNKEKTNFNLDSKIQLNPFYFEGELIIKNKYMKPSSYGIKGRALLMNSTEKTYNAHIAVFY